MPPWRPTHAPGPRPLLPSTTARAPGRPSSSGAYRCLASAASPPARGSSIHRHGNMTGRGGSGGNRTSMSPSHRYTQDYFLWKEWFCFTLQVATTASRLRIGNFCNTIVLQYPTTFQESCSLFSSKTMLPLLVKQFLMVRRVFNCFCKGFWKDVLW
jgi:hypothetical protein